MITKSIKVLVAFVFVVWILTPAYAAETAVAEESCTLEGFSRPLRQTIVVLDELAVIPPVVRSVKTTSVGYARSSHLLECRTPKETRMPPPAKE